MCNYSKVRDLRKKVRFLLEKKVQSKYCYTTFKNFYGINVASANKINSLLGFHPKALYDEDIMDDKKEKILKILSHPKVFIDFQLRRIVFRRLGVLCAIRSYRAFRLLTGLPCRGQRTKSNGRTPGRMLSTERYLPFILLKARHLRKDFINNKRRKKKKKIKQGQIRMFKKGIKAKISKSKAKRLKKLKGYKKKVRNQNENAKHKHKLKVR